LERGYTPRMDLTALPDEVKELVRAQLETGRFQSVVEVLVEALRLLQERE
jgi:Arc/MetJ-type ribon-helix-helix transcriptional regulator